MKLKDNGVAALFLVIFFLTGVANASELVIEGISVPEAVTCSGAEYSLEIILKLSGISPEEFLEGNMYCFFLRFRIGRGFWSDRVNVSVESYDQVGPGEFVFYLKYVSETPGTWQAAVQIGQQVKKSNRYQIIR